MSTQRDAAFDKANHVFHKDYRFKHFLNPVKTRASHYTKKVARCQQCKALVIMPCVLCQPEYYSDENIVVIYPDGTEATLTNFKHFLRLRKKFNVTAGKRLDTLADSLIKGKKHATR